MNKPFTREPLYIVVKVKDAESALSQTEQAILRMISHKVANWRTSQGKTNLSGVFVEHDWPEHDGVWAALEKRHNATSMQPANPQPPRSTEPPLVWPDLECVHDFLPSSITTSQRTCIYCKKIEAPI